MSKTLPQRSNNEVPCEAHDRLILSMSKRKILLNSGFSAFNDFYLKRAEITGVAQD
jgi:hypothetical protein